MPNDALTKPTAEAAPVSPAGETRALKGEKQVRLTAPEPQARPKPKKSGGVRRLVAIAVIGAAVIGGAAYWWLNRGLVSTDDAFIDGNTVSLSPQVGGKVLRLLIDDNQRVKAGDLLLEIDPRDYEAARESAKANLDRALAAEVEASSNLDLTRATTTTNIASAEAGLAQARAALAQAAAQLQSSTAEAERAATDVKRYRELIKQNFATHQTLDQAEATARQSAAQQLSDTQGLSVAQAKIGEAQAALDQAHTAAQQIAVKEAELQSAKADVESARAALHTAEINLSYTKIVAPQTGYITRRQVNAGDVIDKNQILATLVFGAPWVTANFKETQLTDMRPGQPVTIHVDAYPGIDFKGHVDSIMHGSGSHFSLLPPENATGNYVKVVQRVPVKIVFDEAPDTLQPGGHVLGLGMSVVPVVDTRPDARGAETPK
ncbi:MAG TPA: HlyD family secretion protein [Dongiaceae bacterium]|nr:HlyD family secretion protein [Dongiaceae bacterium]